MIKEFCDNCNDELEQLTEYGGRQSVRVSIKIDSERADTQQGVKREFCSVSCAINWLKKNKELFHHKNDLR